MSDDLPRIVAVAWGLATSPQRGPKRELSHERIVEAAIEIADAEGLDAVTMQRVAAAFGFTTMALYRYVSSKDELQQLMSDAALDREQLDGVPADDWREGMRAWASVLRRCYAAHPWLLHLPVSGEVLLMPGNMAVVDAGLRALRELRLPPEEALGAIASLSVLVRGYMALETEMSGRSGASASGAAAPTPSAALRALIKEVATPQRFPDLAPFVADGSYLGELPPGTAPATGPVDLEIAGGVETFLAGLAHRAEQLAAEGRDAPAAGEPADPEEAYGVAVARWQQAVQVRKAAQRRVHELEAEEARLQRVRDDAKELAKAAARLRGRRA